MCVCAWSFVVLLMPLLKSYFFSFTVTYLPSLQHDNACAAQLADAGHDGSQGTQNYSLIQPLE